MSTHPENPGSLLFLFYPGTVCINPVTVRCDSICEQMSLVLSLLGLQEIPFSVDLLPAGKHPAA